LRHRLGGDLGTIVMMALRKEPGRRYSSVEQLSDDMRRHLEGLPVTARKATLFYRTAKFVRRNRASLITAASSFVVMLVLIGVGLYSSLLRNRAVPLQQNLSASGAIGVQVRSLAVLPFQPLVANARDESIESGLADALITKLSNIPKLTVRQTQSVLKYRGLGQDPLVVGRELRVDALLVGSVYPAGDRIRLSVQLISAGDGSVLWV